MSKLTDNKNRVKLVYGSNTPFRQELFDKLITAAEKCVELSGVEEFSISRFTCFYDKSDVGLRSVTASFERTLSGRYIGFIEQLTIGITDPLEEYAGVWELHHGQARNKFMLNYETNHWLTWRRNSLGEFVLDK